MTEREINIEKIKNLNLLHHLPTEYYNQALDYEKIGNKGKYVEYLNMAKDAIVSTSPGSTDSSNDMFITALVQ